MTKPFLRFFRWFCHPTLRSSIEGDLIELYNERFSRSGKRVADLLLAVDVILLFRPSIIRPIKSHNKNYMFRNYFTIGWRNLLRNKRILRNQLLTKSFVLLVAFPCLFAFPIAWYVLSTWLTRFEYRVEISLWIFPIVILGALLVTLATVSYQALRAAMLNPVESLKPE